MALYSRGLEQVFERKLTGRYWYFVEGKPPHGVKVRTCTEPMIERANVDLDAILPEFKTCEETNNWPCYSEEAQAANLTSYGWEINYE